MVRWRWRRLAGLVGIALLSFLLTSQRPIWAHEHHVSLEIPRSIVAASPSPADLGDRVEQGLQLYQNGQFQEAADLWQQVIATDALSGDRRQHLRAQIYLSLAKQELGQWAAAATAIQTALAELQTEPPSHRAEQTEDAPARLLAQALNVRGRLEWLTGRSALALETWKQAGHLYAQLQDKVGVTGSLINQAQALEASGFFRQACTTMMQALAIDQACDSQALADVNSIEYALKHQSDPSMQILGLRNLGNVLRQLGYFIPSQHLLEESLQRAQTLSSASAISASLLSLGQTEQARYEQTRDLYERTHFASDRDQAIALAQQSLHHYQQAIDQTIGQPTLQFTQVQAQLQQLGLRIELSQWSAAHFDEAALQPLIQQQIADLTRQLPQLPPSRTTLYAQLHLAQHLLQLGQLQVALPFVQTSLQQAQRQQDVKAQSYALGTLGQLYEQLSHQQPQTWTQAQQHTEAALGLAQAVQTWDLAYQWQWQLGRIYKAQGKMPQAVAAYEAAVNTLDDVRQNLVAIETDVQFSFRKTVEPIYRQLVALQLQTMPETEAAAEQNQANLRQVIREMDALQVRELENFLRCNLSPTVEISQAAIDPAAAVIYPIILEDQLAVILKLPQTALTVHTIALPRSELEQTLDRLRRELEKPYVSPSGLALAQQVYDWLIRPMQPDLAKQPIQTLVFVLDGALRNVPMAALHDGQHYLIETYAIALTPGLQLFDPKPLTAERLEILAFGLSDVRAGFPPHQNFAPLTNVAVEIQEIRSELPSRTLLNQQFTSGALQNWVSRDPAPIVHLATHGQFSSNPDDTFILAWDKRIGITELSRILQQRDQRSPKAIELLVLSACKTADGDDRAALGLAGVALQSGARSTLASLWYVNDQATAEVMGHFYQALIRSSRLTKAAALREAQLTLLTTRGYQAPRYWAPYVLVGNWL